MFVAAAVASDELHPAARYGDVEQAGVGGVGEVEPHDLASAGRQGEVGVAGGEHHVAEAAHRDVRRAGGVERGQMLHHLTRRAHHTRKTVFPFSSTLR